MVTAGAPAAGTGVGRWWWPVAHPTPAAPPTAMDGDAVIGRLLHAVRQELGMETAFIGRVTAGERVVCHVAGDGVAVGTREPAEQTYCQLILDGQVGPIVRHTAEVPALQRLPVTDRLAIASYIGVPLELSDGTLFGTLCAYSSEARPDLDEGDLRVVRLVADLLSDRLERHVRDERDDAERLRRVSRLIDAGQPDVVFQPIVDLRDRSTVGFEALARFTVEPALAPDAWFAEAATVGLGTELELAAIANALVAAEPLPEGRYVSVNVSPSTACDDRLRDVLRGATREVVVEVTEHDHGRDGLEACLEQLRRDGHRTAVDDAGAGYAGWTRILQLHPEIIKLDRGIVAGVDADLARQAMITAAVSFVAASGAELVAEGVETEAEAAVLAALGVTMVQGYLTGRPAPPRARSSRATAARPGQGRAVQPLEVFADVACPFAHAGLERFRAVRAELGRREPVLRVRSWPLELVNEAPHDGRALEKEVVALRDGVAPDLFTGFSADDVPTSTLTALALEEAAYGIGLEVGERCNAALRDALFEQGLDVSDRTVLAAIAADLGVPMPTADHEAAVVASLAEGRTRGVTGSPHFFTGQGDFFAPSLQVDHGGGGIEVSFDAEGYAAFVDAVFDRSAG